MRTLLLTLCLAISTLLGGEAPVAPLGPPDTLFGKSMDEWIEHLRTHESEKERTIALFCLSEFGSSAAAIVPELRKLLKEDLQPAIPARVVETLGAIGEPAAPAIPELIQLFNDGNRTSQFRGKVIEALSRIDPRNQQARKAFQNSLRNNDEDEVRRAALDAAVNFASAEQSILVTLNRALSRPDDGPIAARSLASLGPAGLNVLLKALEKGDNAARVAAAEGLMPLGRDAASAVPQLMRLAGRDAKNQRVYWRTAMCLAPSDPAVLDALGEQIASGTELSVEAGAEKTGKPYETELHLLAVQGTAALSAIRKAMRSASPDVRKELVQILAQLKEPPSEAIDDLVARAQDRDEKVRVAAIKALDAFGPKAAQAKAQLEEIARADASVRHIAMLAALSVSRQGDTPRARSTFETKSVDEALAALKSADASERLDAVEGLRGRSDHQEAVAAALIETLKDADVEVRSRAARTLAQYGKYSAPAIPIFAEWLTTAATAEKPDKNMILQASGALAGFAGMADGAKPALPVIIDVAVSAAVDGEKDLQKVLSLCLRIIGPDSVAPLTALFKSDDANVRRRAAETLAQMGIVGAAAIPELLQLSNSAIESDSRAAFSAIEAMGPIAYPLAAPSLVGTLTDDLFAERRRYAAQTLGGIGVPKEVKDRFHVLDVLQNALLDPEEIVCRTAQESMVRIGEPALPRLKEMLDLGQGAASYWWAVRALAREKVEADRVIPLLIELTRSGVRTVKVGAFAEKGVAAELLGNYAPEHREMIPALLRCLSDREEYVANAAIRSLKLFGPEIVLSVKPLLSSSDPRVRDGARRALLELQTP